MLKYNLQCMYISKAEKIVILDNIYILSCFMIFYLSGKIPAYHLICRLPVYLFGGQLVYSNPE